MKERLRLVGFEWERADALRRLELVQERTDLERQLGKGAPHDSEMYRLEDDFVRVATACGEEKGIS